jgi:hypothetical protein
MAHWRAADPHTLGSAAKQSGVALRLSPNSKNLRASRRIGSVLIDYKSALWKQLQDAPRVLVSTTIGS